MPEPEQLPAASGILDEQRQANERLVLATLRSMEMIDVLEQRALKGERRLEHETRQHLADRKELQNANRLATLGRVCASVAHELGTPLAVIHARAQMIAAGDVPEHEMAAEATVILEQVDRMTRMVREVLALGRPEAITTPTPVDLAALARQTVTMLAPLTRNHRVKLAFANLALPVWVSGDSSRLVQILSNLVINATQATENGGLVELRLARRRACPPDGVQNEYVALDVADQGVGMSPAVLERLFEPFFTTRSDSGGTGLGLGVSQRIAREHGGFIAVTSEVDRGSCFTLYLPGVASAV